MILLVLSYIFALFLFSYEVAYINISICQAIPVCYYLGFGTPANLFVEFLGMTWKCIYH